MTDRIFLPVCDDFHVHLRQPPELTQLAQAVATGGVGRCLVMPNTTPPIVSASQVREYRQQLCQAEPSVEFLFLLYLCVELRPEHLAGARHEGVIGVKSYPRGVTTGSDQGVENFEIFYPVFNELQRLNMSLHLHGEHPWSDPLLAEQDFLPQLRQLHQDFPRLRIVLEHCTTAEGVACVKRLGPTVAATITVHHLCLTAEDIIGAPHCFCKPLPKLPADRLALQQAVGHPKFFLGSDSAPHKRKDKEYLHRPPAGVFTSPRLIPLLAHVLDGIGKLEYLEEFAARFGADFLNLPRSSSRTLVLHRQVSCIPREFGVCPILGGEAD
jgi:dihydroorotase